MVVVNTAHKCKILLAGENLVSNLASHPKDATFQGKLTGEQTVIHIRKGNLAR